MDANGGAMRARDADARVVAANVAQRWLDHHGPTARAWLDRVPEIASEWAEQWNLVLGPALDGGSVSVVLRVETADGSAVLKLAAPWSRTAAEEVAALRAWDGDGAARLLMASDDGRALLLERVQPGTRAAGLDASQIAGLIERLSRPAVPSVLPTLADAVRVRFDRAAENRHGLLSTDQLARARTAAVELADRPQSAPVLCHGDLLSKNILVSERDGLLAIDPNPCAGSVAFDAALWAGTELPVTEAPTRAADIARALRIPTDEVLRWLGVLLAVEVCLASLARAEASLELAKRLDEAWVRG
jgi:streptomycin 6-kinase